MSAVMHEPTSVGEVTIGRSTIAFTRHCRDRWCEDGQPSPAMLREAADGTYSRKWPKGLRLSTWHSARARGFIEIPKGVFVVTENSDGKLWAVTFVSRFRIRG